MLIPFLTARHAAILLALALCASLPLRAAPAAVADPALEQIIEEGTPTILDRPVSLADRERIAALYSGNGYRLLWSDGSQPTSAARQLLSELRQAPVRGLNPDDYSGGPLAALVSAADRWALFDAGLSFAGLRFVSDLHYGRVDPAAVGHNLTVARVGLDLSATLVRLSAAADVSRVLDSLEPHFTHYALLKSQLARYRLLAATPGLTDLPAYERGHPYPGAPGMFRLLSALGDVPADTAPQRLPVEMTTPALVDGLKHFQGRHGQRADGTLGKSTYDELTRPLGARVRQIELTMERWRWLPAELTSAPIIVNIPEFRLFAFDSPRDSEAHMLQMDVIVGKAFEATQTPVFAADMKYVVFRPYWDVPYSITMKEIVPAARRDPATIERHQMQMVRGGEAVATVMPNTRENVEALARGALRLRQIPGPDNSLGLVKFMFPNPYNVYLHSTPAQSLFAEPRRAFSHGCVRVSDPVALAQYVLRDTPEWTREKIIAAMNGAAPLTVTLKNHIRVYIVYGTAVALEDGNMLFFDDVYGHDARLEAALDARSPR